MSRQFIFAVFVLATMWRFGWRGLADSFQAPDSSRVIYGEDNRLDFYQLEDPAWQDIAQSTVALFDVDDLLWGQKDSTYFIQSEVYGDSFGLCRDEPFYYQPSSAFCSGFLIDSNIVITAGHCLRNQLNCERVRFVFGYSVNNPDISPLNIPENQVYQCAEILSTKNNGPSGEDFSIVRLDRPVEDYQPLDLRTDGDIKDNQELTVIGYPRGIPGKLAHGGKVRDNSNPIFFLADLDTFGGNSGSAVFNSETRLVEGVLVRGEKDFIFDQKDRCRRSYKCKEGECRGEDVVRISEVLNRVREFDYISRISN